MPLACLPYSIAINSRRPLDQRDWQVQTELAAVRWLDCLAWRVPPKYSAEHKRLRHLWSLSSVRLGPSGEEIQVTGRQMTRCGKRNCRTVSFCLSRIARAVTPLSSEDHVVNTFTRRKYSFFFQRFWKDLISRKSSPAPDEGDDGSKALPEL